MDWFFDLVKDKVFKGKMKEIYLLIFNFVAGIVLTNFILFWPDGKLYYIQCDVGQGDAILIKKDFDQILVDSGKGSGVKKCLEKNIPFWDHNLEVVVVTHNDEDHIGGMREVLKNYNAKVLIGNGELTENWLEIERQIDKNKTEIMDASRIEKIKLGEIEMNFWWPRENTEEEGNNASVVFQTIYGKTKILLTGDINTKIEEELVRRKIDLKSDILKIAHHGSCESTGEMFLERVSPRIGVIGVGENKYGHPCQNILEKSEARGVRIRRTDKEGEIKIKIGDEAIEN